MSECKLIPRRHLSEHSLAEVAIFLEQSVSYGDLAAVALLAQHLISRVKLARAARRRECKVQGGNANAPR